MTKYFEALIKFIKPIKKDNILPMIYNVWYDCESCEYVKEAKIEIVIH